MRTRGWTLPLIVASSLIGLAPVRADDAPLDPSHPPVVVLYTPADVDDAAEQAYEAALPFLGQAPARALLPLETALPETAPGELVGWTVVACPADEGAPFEELVARAEDETTMVELEAARATVAEAEMALACGQASPLLAGRLAATRALIAWMDGERDQAGRAWRELYALQPGRSADAELPPDAQAAQLAAKTAVAQAPPGGLVHWLLEEGWTVSVDGLPAGDEPLLAGRRIVRLDGPEGALGGVVEVQPGTSSLVGSGQAIDRLVAEGQLDEALVGWLASALAPALETEGVDVALVVDLTKEPAAVWRVKEGSALLLSLSEQDPGPGSAPVARARVDPRAVGGVVLGGGIAAALVGIVVASVAHRDGFQMDMESPEGFSDHYEAYELARERERFGVGLAVGGGVVAAGGAVVIVIPSVRRGGGS